MCPGRIRTREERIYWDGWRKKWRGGGRECGAAAVASPRVAHMGLHVTLPAPMQPRAKTNVVEHSNTH